MGRIVVTEFLTLDGVMEAPNLWSSDFWSDEATKFKTDEVFASDAQLLGRVTYVEFAASWPSATDEEGLADRMNSMPKYVASTTLEKAEWNNSTLLKGNIPEEVARLKQQPGQDILVHGSADLVHTLTQYQLVDEYRFMVFPFVQGSGKRLFREGVAKTALNLVDSKAFASGVVVLTYRPKM